GKVELFAGEEPQRLHEAVALAASMGALVELAWAEENLGIALGTRGDIPAALALITAAIERLRPLGLDQIAYLIADYAMTRSFLTEDVADGFAEAEAILPTDDFRFQLLGMRGDVALRAGHFDEAIALYEACAELGRTMPGVVPLAPLCYLPFAYMVVGRRADA